MLGEHVAVEPDPRSETPFCEKPGCSPHCQLSAKLISFFSFSYLISPTSFSNTQSCKNVRFCITTSHFSPWRNDHQKVGLGLVFRKMPPTNISWYPTPCTVPLVALQQEFCKEVEIWNSTLVNHIWDHRIPCACPCWLCRLNFSEHLRASNRPVPPAAEREC